MNRLLFRLVAVVFAVAFAATPSRALTIGTTVPNSGAGGTWMNLTATNTTLYVTSFQIYFQNATVGTAASVQVWRRPGTYVGFTTASTGWTLHQTISTASAGQTTLVTLNLSTPIIIPAGQTMGVYLICLTSGNGIRYINPGSQPTWSNSDITLYSEHSKITNVAFSTTNIATPRCFAGLVNYIRDPLAVGACCRDDGSCTAGAPADCESAPVGLWQGAGTTCGTVACPQPGACCGPQNGACAMAVGWACVSPNTFTSAGTTCTPTNPCPQGACCKPDASCTSVTQNWCETSGGVFMGNSIACASAACPQPGACCLPNGGCAALTQSDCLTIGGTFGGSGVICALGNCWTAPILYHNGGVVTHPGAGGGGADAAQAPPGSNAVGASFNSTTKVASEFKIPPGQVWSVNKFRTIGYQTGASSASNPFTTLYVRIWDRDPRVTGATVLWGDLTTNALDVANSAFSNTYRMANNVALTDTQRPMFNLIANVPDVHLGHGTYWVEWSALNGATAFISPVTAPLGIPFGNTIQSGATNVYVRLYDSTYKSASWINNPGGFPYSLPYVIEGTVGVGGACCQADGSCVMAVGDPLVCASGTAVPNGTCSPNSCPQPQGACCMPDGSCTFGLASACVPSGGAYSSNDTTCGAAGCPQPGACCLPNGGCAALLSSECTSAGGAFTSAGVLCAAGNCWTAPILYHNGGIVTDPGAGPGGEDVSQVALTSNTAGYSWNFSTGFRVADDFTIPAGQTWAVNRFRTWGYQTGAPTTPLPYTAMYVRIFDRDPRDANAVLVWGDLTTNRLDTVNSAFANIYRVFNGVIGDTQRAVFNLVADVPNVQLTAGTYWVEYSAVNGATPNIPHVTTPGFIPFGNALQFNATAWNPLRDTSFQAPAYAGVGGKPFGIPFILEGTIGAPGGVCCRGATCSTAFATEAACLAAPPALQPGASHKWIAGSAICNAPPVPPATIGNAITPCCVANYNHNAQLEVQDIFDFLNDWFAGKTIAMPSGDGDTGALAVQNIFDFLNAWFAGGCN